jgi:hypothetical protein
MYPYQEYLNEAGISSKDFAYICAMSSWAVCGQRSKNEDVDNDHGCDDQEDSYEDNNTE